MFIQTNPNPNGSYVGDCVVRAIALAEDRTWNETYINLCLTGLVMYDMPSSNRVWMEGYSNDYSNDGSYARGRNARRDSMGRYSRDAGSYGDGSYARGSYEQGYSREAKEDLEMELRQMKAKNPEASHMIDMWMDQLSRN